MEKETRANFRLKEARFMKGLTQQQLADMIEMPLITYATKENGKSVFTETEIKKICGVLEREVTEIFF